MDTLFILGRQPEIGLAELEALSDSSSVHQINDTCATGKVDIAFSRLGSSQKSGPILAVYNTTDIHKVFASLTNEIPSLIANMPTEGKVKLGASLYGFDATAYTLQGELLRLKKYLRNHGRSARVIPNETVALSSATTYHNHLTRELGLEFALVRDGKQTIVARMINVQDIDNYRIRDRERPKRDAFVGMLPPKLAQTMINLAQVQHQQALWDPFCGTGVILMEAMLQGISVYGSDVSEKMVKYTDLNIAWLIQHYNQYFSSNQDVRYETFVGDATKFQLLVEQSSRLQSIVTETYLGQPLGGQHPSEDKIHDIIRGVNKISRDFLENVSKQVASGTRHCIAFPAWYIDDHEYHLPVIDELADLGFERISFASTSNIIYHREDQITAREILVLIKN
ncbi:hypothetical protein EOL73_00975 [Candidatus Saccharibacteria bacterium]|nr:hypothetical protein [Candidatus Saccharibacteria bacterium]